jgi:predicted transcriptional regulator
MSSGGAGRGGHRHGGGRRTNTPTEKEALLVRIAELDRKGYNQYDIAEVIGVSQAQICQDLKRIREMYKESTVEERATAVNRKVAQLNDLIREAWLAYERSKLDVERKVVERTPEFQKPPEKEAKGKAPKPREKAKLRRSKITITTEGRLPGVEYLRLVFQCLVEQSDLLELKPKDKKDERTFMLNWNLLEKAVQAPSVDLIEQRLAEYEQANTPRIEGKIKDTIRVNGTLTGQAQNPNDNEDDDA